MKKIILKVLLGLSPVLIVLAIYAVMDPFKVLYHYDSYYPKDGVQHVTLNNDFTTVQAYLDGYKKYGYDTYIFGNSKGLIFHTDKLQQHIPGGKIFQFSVSNEGLFGVESKLRLIDSLGGEIKHVLLVLDDPLYKLDKELPAFPKHPLLSSKSMLTFQVNNVKGFFEKDFLIPYLKMIATGEVDNTFFVSGLDNKRCAYDVATNDLKYPDLDPSIDADTTTYYTKRSKIFYLRPPEQKYAAQHLKATHIAQLRNIKRILDKHHADYKIVITPQYNQLKPEPHDYAILQQILGAEHFYDFSGINDITNDRHNYYENVHFRPFIANRIMDSIYGK